MMRLRLFTQGRWIDAKGAIPAERGIYHVLVSESESTFGHSARAFSEIESRWVAQDGGTAPEGEVIAWFLPDSETARLQGVINRAREILGSVPTEWPEISPSDPALYNHLAAIRNARAVLDEGTSPDPSPS